MREGVEIDSSGTHARLSVEGGHIGRRGGDDVIAGRVPLVRRGMGNGG
jgi:hypothetical protein